MLVRDPWQTQEWRFFGLSRVTYGHGGGTEVGLWIGVGGAVYWVGGSFVPRRAESVAWKEVRSDGASLELILIWASSERCGLFGVQDMSSGDQPIWG